MSKKKGFQNKNAFPGMMPFMPPMFPMAPMPMAMPPMPQTCPWNFGAEQSSPKSWAKDFEKNMKSYWEKSIDIQKSTADNSREQYIQFFDYLMDMQDSFADSLPDQAWSPFPGMPAFPITPKAFMKHLKEFEKMLNDHFIQQADASNDLFIQGQQKAVDVVSEAAQNAEKQDEKNEAAENSESGEQQGDQQQ